MAENGKKKIFKMILYTIIGFIAVFIVFGILYMAFSPQMGKKNGGYPDSPNYKDGKFQNLVETKMSTGDSSMVTAMYEFFFNKHVDAFPSETIQTEKINTELINSLEDEQVAVTWLGHSTALISTHDLTILTDPVLSGKRIPPMYMGPKPFPYSETYRVENLPEIDVVLISHDHYDHLDYETIKKLTDKKFYAPLGVKAHLMSWGVSEENITELDWHEGKKHLENIEFTFTPTRHFSGRGLLNGRSTLWGAWVIGVGEKKIYFGGDSGYFEEFKKVGETYGPFDIAFLDTGQYNEAWQALHMLPNEVVQAAKDLQAKTFIPIHNSKYILSLHAWYEPLERVTKEAKEKNVHVTTPKIGQTFLLNENLPTTKWWKE